MRWPPKWLVWTLALGVPAVLIGAPFLRADPFEAPLRRALEKTLGRKVAIVQGVRYLSFPSPGLTAREVVIDDDPRFGLEPFAYVGSLDARVSVWRSVWNRRLEIGSVRMDDASINLARAESEGWNLTALLSRITAGMKSGAPDLLLRGGRINFRNGLLKSPFYLNNVDLDMTLEAGSFTWNYDASPARTDRSEQGFGRLTGKGRWSPAAGIDLDLDLERSSTSEVVTLLAGRELGVRGRMTSRAHLWGPLEAVRIAGSIQMEGLERGSLFGVRGPALRMPYEGMLNVTEQKLALSSAKNEKETPPLVFAFDVERLMTNPRWKASLRFDELPPQDVLNVWRRFGAQIPDDLVLTGKMNGELTLSQEQPAEGRIELLEAQVKLGPAVETTLEKAEINLTGSEMVLAPITWKSGEGEAIISGSWAMASEAAQIGLRMKGLATADVRTLLTRLPRSEAAPFFDALEDGQVSGTLTLRRREDGTGAWSGDAEVADAHATVPGLEKPLLLEHASVAVQGADFTLRKLKVRDGAQVWEGSLQRRAGSARPVQFKLATAEMSAAALERMAGAVLPGSRNFFARTLRLEPTSPDWMKTRRVEGELRIGALNFGETTVAQVAARVYWDGTRIDMPLVEGRWMEGRFSGRLESRAGAPPQYVLLGRLENGLWKGARFDADIDLRAAGLSGAMRGEGNFQARNVTLGDDVLRLVSGCWDLTADRTGARAHLRCLEALSGGESFAGAVATSPDGHWNGELAGPRRTLRVGGTLSPLVFEAAGQ